MQLNKYFLLVLLALFFGIVTCGKLKLVAFKGHHGGFIGLKVRKPKLLGHGFGGGFGGGLGSKLGGFGGGYHSSGYEHHESHHSYHSSGGGGFGSGFGGWLGK